MAMIMTVTVIETTTAITTGIMTVLTIVTVFEIFAVTGNSGYERDLDCVVRHRSSMPVKKR